MDTMNAPQRQFCHPEAHSPEPSSAAGGWRVIVAIPARNEGHYIERCLHSVMASVKAASSRVDTTRIVVVADSCSDDTAAIARATLADMQFAAVAECRLGNSAKVRALGVAAAKADHLPSELDGRTWIANTDADTVVPSDWISKQLVLAEAGATAVAGIVSIDEFPGLPATAARHFAEHYSNRLTPGGSHPHVHAANLGVRLDAYDRAGGWGCLPRSEDRDLWTRLQRTGACLVSTTEISVTTSGRSVGRVGGGFADWLRAHVAKREQLEYRVSRGPNRGTSRPAAARPASDRSYRVNPQ